MIFEASKVIIGLQIVYCGLIKYLFIAINKWWGQCNDWLSVGSSFYWGGWLAASDSFMVSRKISRKILEVIFDNFLRWSCDLLNDVSL